MKGPKTMIADKPSSEDIRSLIADMCVKQEHFDPNSDYPGGEKVIKITPDDRRKIILYLSILHQVTQ